MPYHRAAFMSEPALHRRLSVSCYAVYAVNEGGALLCLDGKIAATEATCYSSCCSLMQSNQRQYVSKQSSWSSFASTTRFPECRVSFCINQAVGEWIATRLPVLMERFDMTIQSVGIMHPPTPINPAKKDAAGKEWYKVMKEAGKRMKT